MKSDKKKLKREIESTHTDNKEPAKKLKKTNDINGTSSTDTPTETTADKLKSVNTSLFAYFKELTHEEVDKRTCAVLQLIQQLNKTTDVEKREKELKYTLKRLIRGCGASSNSSRSGFFTGLVAFLKFFSSGDVPLAWVFDTIKKELNVGATIANKEDADAVVGKILACGGILRSGRIQNAGEDYLEQTVNILLQSARHRTYHSSLAYSFLIEIVQSLPQKQFELTIWPLLKNDLIKPWQKQTIQTVQCLIAVQKSFPNLVNTAFFKAHLNGPEMLNSTSYAHLYKMFWDHSNMNVITHPAMEQFGVYISSCAKLSEFWTDTVDPGLQAPNKLLEIESLKIATDILNNLDTSKTKVVSILSPNFMKMFVEGLKRQKQKKDEALSAFYDEFQDALVTCCEKLKDDEQKVNVIRRLIEPPGIFNIEKYTKSKIVHQLIGFLGEAGVKDLFELYKGIFFGKSTKKADNAGNAWMNFERINAGYMLQHLLAHRSMKSAYDWREEQLKLLLKCGIFYVTDALELCKKDAAGEFSKTFSEQCRNMFFTSLQGKLTDLGREKDVLMHLVESCNETLQQKHGIKSVMVKNFNETELESWNRLLEALETNSQKQTNSKKSKKKENGQLELVFQFLLIHMGLQLFREPEMATPAIDDLLKCIERAKTQKKSKTGKNKQDEVNEPEWIDVVVDLFLHLLSQNTNALRNIVNSLFPHFCSNLNLSTIHQILAMLDMKNGENPLSGKGDDGENDDEQSSESENEYDGSEVEHLELENHNDDDDSDEEDSGSEDEDESDDEEDITVNDKLRNAISQALMETGAAATRDDDMESIDLNEITEEEGRKLDKALVNAFKAIKGSSVNGSRNKKSRSNRIKTTTVMHFRIRVLDLIEIYLQQSPSLMIVIEIMLALFEMLQHCFDPELQPLQQKVERTLTKLVANKAYKIEEEQLQEEDFISFMRLIVEKRAPTLAFDATNKMRSKCLVFLIMFSNRIFPNQPTAKLLELWQEYIKEFITSRNPLLNSGLLCDIFKIRWNLIWDLGVYLVKTGISVQTRTFRRIQLFEILSVLYRNTELQKLDVETTKSKLKKIEKTIGKYIAELVSDEKVKHSFKEFQTIIQFLMDVEKVHKRLNTKSMLISESMHADIQKMRKTIKLESMHVYQRYCGVFKLQPIRNNGLNLNEEHVQNGHHSTVKESDANANSIEVNGEDEDAVDTAEGKVSSTNGPTSQTGKRKPASDTRKLKKLRKLKRLEAASAGLVNVETSKSDNNPESD